MSPSDKRWFEDMALALETSARAGKIIVSCDTLASICRRIAKMEDKPRT